MAKVDIWLGFAHMRLSLEVSDEGEIDRNAIRAFTEGQCHALALAVHELTRWPVMGILDSDRDKDSPSHCVMLRPDGELLDINGPNAYERWHERHGRYGIRFISPKKLPELKHYMEPNVAAARPFAKTLVAKYGKY